MLDKIAQCANALDKQGFTKQADELTHIITTLAFKMGPGSPGEPLAGDEAEYSYYHHPAGSREAHEAGECGFNCQYCWER